ncbi:MAG: pseudouridine-5'-phosphate glycosidase [Phycisphaerales bacterium]|nr:pseudouridine-5'-phosphate glycosidase [Planctomycetota bacterium]
MASLPRLALESTILTHGVPRSAAAELARDLSALCRLNGAQPALVGIFRGRPTAELTEDELTEMLRQSDIAKANTSNLGVLLHRKAHASTTVAATMEIAATAGIRVFATGGIGGVHQGFANHLDISSDLAAFTRFPVAVISSGVKSILDVVSTRELLESLGVPVIGFGTDSFPAFYLRSSRAGVDARFDDVASLAEFVSAELSRTGRGILIVNPIPPADELNPSQFESWLEEARRRIPPGVPGRSATPLLLGGLHEVSAGATLRANLSLIRSNTTLGARLAAALGVSGG